MSIRFDEKGKFFTDVISKEAVFVIIQTLHHNIHGRLHIRPEERLKDELNQSELFFAVTEATIFNNSGEEIYSCDFIAINRDHIAWIIPKDQLIQDEPVKDGGES